MSKRRLYMALYMATILLIFVCISIILEQISIFTVKCLLLLCTILIVMRFTIPIRQRIALYSKNEPVIGTRRWVLSSAGAVTTIATFAVAWLVSFKFAALINIIIAISMYYAIIYNEESSDEPNAKECIIVYVAEQLLLCIMVYLGLYLAKL